MPPKRERVRGETLGSLYRTLCSEADGRRKDVRRERLDAAASASSKDVAEVNRCKAQLRCTTDPNNMIT